MTRPGRPGRKSHSARRGCWGSCPAVSGNSANASRRAFRPARRSRPARKPRDTPKPPGAPSAAPPKSIASAGRLCGYPKCRARRGSPAYRPDAAGRYRSPRYRPSSRRRSAPTRPTSRGTTAHSPDRTVRSPPTPRTPAPDRRYRAGSRPERRRSRCAASVPFRAVRDGGLWQISRAYCPLSHSSLACIAQVA